ncbi:MAG: T9SS type A sorting domain-containing protein [Bacteroidota bacterium]
MKLILQFTFIFCISCSHIFSQSGCTDQSANNYNSLATSNDGSCTYNVTTESVNPKGSIVTNVTESSGLVFTNGVIWTHNDSGNPSNIFKIDTANGNVLQTVAITNFPNIDWEDITADSNYIYVGDFGNNNGTRTDLKVLKISKSQLTSTLTSLTATAQAINFSYSDQTSFASNSNTNYDCESVISIGNFLYLFTKNRGDLQTRVYKLSKTPGTYTTSPYTSFNVNGKITGADYNKQTNEIALIGYMASSKNSFFWFLNDFTGDLFFSGNKRRIEIGNSSNDWQTEGVTFAANNELFLSCETSYTPATLYNTYKSNNNYVGIKETKNQTSSLKIFPNPTTEIFEVESDDIIKEIEISTLEGKILLSKKIEQNHTTIKSTDFTNINGCYALKIKTQKKVLFHKICLISN